MTILSILNELAATASINDKVAILKREKDNDLLKQVFQAAYNPLVNFYIKKIPAYNPCEDVFPGSNLSWAIDGLDVLSSRKLTGNAAIEHLTTILENLGEDNAIVIERIIDRDLRCGTSDTLASRVWPGLVPTFDVMLASKLDESKIIFPCQVEPKVDGLRVLVFIQDYEIKFLSRGGKEFTTFNHLINVLLKRVPDSLRSRGIILDCEGISLRGGFQQACSDIKRDSPITEDVGLVVFDIIEKGEFTSTTKITPQFERTALVQKLFKNSNKIIANTTTICGDISEVFSFYENMKKAGYEGVIVKSLHAFYENKRSRNWMKIKPLDNVEVGVVSAFEGTGKYTHMLGGFDVDFNGKICSVGGGFSDQQRKDFWKDKENMIGSIIEVMYMEQTTDGSMRHPRFVALRTYKGGRC